MPVSLHQVKLRSSQIQRSLDESRAEVVQLKAERQLCEENMKKAFMRGVCALNLEAMSVFRTPRDAAIEPAGHHGNIADGDHTPSPGVQTPDLHQAASSLPTSVGQTFPKSVHVATSSINGYQQPQSRPLKPSMVTMAPPRTMYGRRGQGSKGPPIVVERHTSA